MIHLASFAPGHLAAATASASDGGPLDVWTQALFNSPEAKVVVFSGIIPGLVAAVGAFVLAAATGRSGQRDIVARAGLPFVFALAFVSVDVGVRFVAGKWPGVWPVSSTDRFLHYVAILAIWAAIESILSVRFRSVLLEIRLLVLGGLLYLLLEPLVPYTWRDIELALWVVGSALLAGLMIRALVSAVTVPSRAAVRMTPVLAARFRHDHDDDDSSDLDDDSLDEGPTVRTVARGFRRWPVVAGMSIVGLAATGTFMFGKAATASQMAACLVAIPVGVLVGEWIARGALHRRAGHDLLPGVGIAIVWGGVYALLVLTCVQFASLPIPAAVLALLAPTPLAFLGLSGRHSARSADEHAIGHAEPGGGTIAATMVLTAVMAGGGTLLAAFPRALDFVIPGSEETGEGDPASDNPYEGYNPYES